ncbi:hypothetical protein GUJ93_ZPchr0006g45727 [Zizania palustris]|uniref:GPN-loop GTPase 2 n=1 Tax=Zizania palustris TaxID=103762 RepID=A0A8J5SR62_ZIZPA|nr:hypothetical protein GUJ93_ZPchr0006g45727 [Zizania palustris]
MMVLSDRSDKSLLPNFLYTSTLWALDLVKCNMQVKWNFSSGTQMQGVLSINQKYAIAFLLSLSTMLHLELPHINILSKINLIENYGNLAFNLNFYIDVKDLSYLQHHLDQGPRSVKYRKLTMELCNVIDDFSLVNFTTSDIHVFVGNIIISIKIPADFVLT